MSVVALANPRGRSGGLLLLGTAAVRVDIMVQESNVIEWMIREPGGWEDCHCIGVYAPSDDGERLALWNRFRDRGVLHDRRLMIGSFHDITRPTEKVGGATQDFYSCCPLRTFIEDIGLVDLGFQGYPYTWNNKREGEANIRERLDRAFGSAGWVEAYPESKVFHLRLIGSDHVPILMDMKPSIRDKRRRFLFDKGWVGFTGCEEEVRQGWEGEIVGRP
jgi:hypothetical protein